MVPASIAAVTLLIPCLFLEALFWDYKDFSSLFLSMWVYFLQCYKEIVLSTHSEFDCLS